MVHIAQHLYKKLSVFEVLKREEPSFLRKTTQIYNNRRELDFFNLL